MLRDYRRRDCGFLVDEFPSDPRLTSFPNSKKSQAAIAVSGNLGWLRERKIVTLKNSIVAVVLLKLLNIISHPGNLDISPLSLQRTELSEWLQCPRRMPLHTDQLKSLQAVFFLLPLRVFLEVCRFAVMSWMIDFTVIFSAVPDTSHRRVVFVSNQE
jgi:hypothetical protein